MAELKTKPNNRNVGEFIKAIEDENKREGCLVLIKIMQEITESEPVMWGNTIVGFGKYHFKYNSGREGDWFLTGFSPGKQNLTIYMMCGLQSESFQNLLDKLGKYKMGKSCLYIKKLEDIDVEILKELIIRSVKQLSEKYSCT